MKKHIVLLAAALCLVLAGCSLLERDYQTLEPHSSSFRDKTDENALRAGSYQDLVNAILMLAEERQETGRLHLYEGEIVDAWTMLRDARDEILQQTPAGAYALANITWKTSGQRDYCSVDLTLTYRRTEAEEDAIIDASSSNAVYDLIPFALEEKRRCLAVRFSHLDQAPTELTENILSLQIERLRQELEQEGLLPPEEGNDASEGTVGETPSTGEETPVDTPDKQETSPPAEGETPTEGEMPPEEGELPPEEPEIVPEIPWRVYLYPDNENAGIVEIFFW